MYCLLRCSCNIGAYGLKSGELIQDLINNLRVQCTQCKILVASTEYLLHSKRCAESVLTKSKTLEPTDVVPKEAHEIVGNVTRVLLAQSQNNVIQIRTGGSVSIFQVSSSYNRQ